MRIAALSALLAAAACGPPLPPPLTPLALKAPALEPAPEVTDPTLFGYLRLRKLPELIEKLGIPNGNKLVASLGISLNDLPPESPIAVYMWAPGDGGLAALPLAAMIPLAPDTPLPARLRLMLGPGNVLPAPGGTLVSITPPALERARSQAGALAKLAAAPMSSQIQLLMRLPPIRARFQTQIDEFFDKLAKTPSKKTETPAEKRIQGWVQDGIHRWFNELSALTVDETVTSEYMELAFTLHEAAPSSAAAAAPPASSPDLVSFLPDGQIRFELDGDMRGGFVGMMRGIYDALLKEDAATHERMNEWLKRWGDATPGSRIGGVISIGETGMHGASLIYAPRADKFMALIEDGYLLMAAEPMRKAMREGSLEISLDRQVAVRRIQGWTVNRYKYSSKRLTPELTDEQRKLLEKLNNNSFEIVRIGNFVLQTINQPPGVLDALAADLLSGQPHGRPLRAKEEFPTSGLFHADMDIATLYENFRKLMPKNVKLAALESGPPSLTLYGYSMSGLSQYRLRVPAGFIAALRAAFK